MAGCRGSSQQREKAIPGEVNPIDNTLRNAKQTSNLCPAHCQGCEGRWAWAGAMGVGVADGRGRADCTVPALPLLAKDFAA